jgi:hypothetical protein
MKTAGIRTRDVAFDFARTLGVALATGIVFSMVAVAAVVLVAGGAS